MRFPSFSESCAATVACSLLLSACSSEPDYQPALATYGLLAEAEYEDSLDAARSLDAAIEAFLAAPSEATLQAVRNAWLASREPYLQTEAYRYYGGPIEQGEPEREGALNAWPIDESVIDYVRDRNDGSVLTTGLVNEEQTAIDATILRARNTNPGETEVTTGYHPIEFLLWGQDDPDQDGAGRRPHTDYIAGEAANAERRATYLRVAVDLLQEDLAAVLAEWRDQPGTFRSQFTVGGADSMRDVMIGLIEMSGAELGGERIGVALTTRDQEDEHSCFSDNTTREIVVDAIGIRNVYLGRYVRTDGSVVEGPSLSDLVRARDAALDERMRTQLDASIAAAEAIQMPFDRAILSPEGSQRLQRVVAALDAQTSTLQEIAALFELDVATE